MLRVENRTSTPHQWLKTALNLTAQTKTLMNNHYGRKSHEDCITELGPQAYIVDGAYSGHHLKISIMLANVYKTRRGKTVVTLRSVYKTRRGKTVVTLRSVVIIHLSSN
ncbi:hypothetical protein PoB_005979100 [Plakobranchus ocellatus]|uniref:Uncharacterized protein n=1 Tax=Plakobranchus ocellatus TaxID=259542 RepID=A0AAV4CMU8_9GAST|nr:hypothetical protein PoB_005979100 [Plakobranchus ocellatus]